MNAVYSLVAKDQWLHHQHGLPITVTRNDLVDRACQLCTVLRYEFIFAPVSDQRSGRESGGGDWGEGG